MAGYFDERNIPATSGIPRIRKTVPRIFNGFKLISLIITAVSGFKLPQKAIFKGVKIIARTVDIAVMLTERAVLPRARCVIKFDTLPPGQAATRIIPNAMEG